MTARWRAVLAKLSARTTQRPSIRLASAFALEFWGSVQMLHCRERRNPDRVEKEVRIS